MPELIDVPATFKNCAFHGIAAHLLAYPDITSELGIFEQLFKRSKGESVLTDLLPDAQAFEDFFLKVRANKKKRFEGNELEGESFEKVLVLGMALRNFLKQVLLSDQQIRENSQTRFIEMIHHAKENIGSLGKDIFLDSLAQSENGVMAEAVRPIFERVDFETLTEEKLVELWQSIYADAYANRVGELDVTLSYFDIAPLCQKLRIPLNVFAYQAKAEDAHGRVLASLDLEAPVEEKHFEPLTLLLHEAEAHYHVELPEGNPFTQQFKADDALYAKERNNNGDLELEASEKNGLTQHSKLLFLTSILSVADQVKDNRVTFLNSIKKNVSSSFVDREDEFCYLPPMSRRIKLFGVSAPEKKDNTELNRLIGLATDFMKIKNNSKISATGLNAIKGKCFENVSLKDEVEKALDDKMKAHNIDGLTDLLASLETLQLADKMALKLAIYSLFCVKSVEDKSAICENLGTLALFLKGAADVDLQKASVVIFGFLSLIAVVLSISTGVIGLGIGIFALGALCSGAMFYNGMAKDNALAMTTFVQSYQAQKLTTPPSLR